MSVEGQRHVTDYRIAVDIGGTFTDVVLETQAGFVSGKVLTTHEAPEDGVLSGIQEVLKRAGRQASDIGLVIHGTTLATNALIERRGARTGLITTRGFRDVIELAFEHRFDQYDLEMVRPDPLVERPLRLEVTERIGHDGGVLLPLDENDVRRATTTLRSAGVVSIAVSFLHSYANAAHEERARDIIAGIWPEAYVTISHEVCPEIREYERTSTTVANAYVQPLMAGYLSNLSSRLKGVGIAGPLLMIMSSGSLTSIETAMRLPIRLVESGPAGGAILGEYIAREIGADRAVALDMGGTTAKIILLDDYQPYFGRSMEVARAHRFLAGSGLPLRIPVIDLIEIGAGGGSIAKVDRLGRIAVGPESAGSSPGPASYGLGGERPTVTDGDLLLGKMDPALFAGGAISLDVAKAEAALLRHVGQPLDSDARTAAAGISEIVDENMANATRVHATDRGALLDGRTLIATGGAAPLHVARIAEKLGIDSVVVPLDAGVGSARGFLLAPVAYEAVHSAMLKIDRFEPDRLNAIFEALRREAESVVRLVDPGGELTERRRVDMRYRGQGHELSVEIPVKRYEADDADLLRRLFEAQYAKSYSRVVPQLGVDALTWTLVLTGRCAAHPVVKPEPVSSSAPVDDVRIIFDTGCGERVRASVIKRDSLRSGSSYAGPAIIVEDQTTTYVPPAFDVKVSAGGHLVLERVRSAS
jgi:N-methylhydantoinase A